MDKHFLDGEENRSSAGQFRNNYYNSDRQENTSERGNEDHRYQEYSSDYNNNYSYYQQQQEGPQQFQSSYHGGHRHSGKKKKSNNIWRQLSKVICFALIFGLVAGGTFWGVVSLTGTADTQKAANSNQSNAGMNVNIVKTSSTDVKTIEATGVSDIVKETMPAIVSVTTKIQQNKQDFFGRVYSQESQGAGSGIIFSEADNNLYILTNYHVVEGSVNTNVVFANDVTAPATIKGYDSDADIAVLVVNMDDIDQVTKDAIAVAVIGDSNNVNVGEGAIAIGNALGYGQSVTTGVISAVNRQVQLTDGTMTLIQTDAAINPGNSGGALLNTKGEVIGVNTVKFSETSVEGMGYAIPINDAIQTASDILSGKIKSEADTPYLGIYGGTLDEETASANNAPAGVYISGVISNSAAERAGLSAGCIITGFNGQTVTEMEELQSMIENCSPGDTVTITAHIPQQDGTYQETELTTILGSKSDAN